MGKILIIEALEKKDLRECFKIRTEVFVKEQGVPEEEELDDLDSKSIHALAIINNSPVATGRLIPIDNQNAKIGRMAVFSNYRRSGIGGDVLSFLEKKAFDKGLFNITLHAQEYVKNFYLKHEYVQQGETFLEAGIKHVSMTKNLSKFY